MKKEIKVVKLNEDDLLEIVSEYFNFSGKKYVKKGVQATMTKFYGTSDQDLRAVCVLASDSIYNEIDLDEVDKSYDFTGHSSVEFKK